MTASTHTTGMALSRRGNWLGRLVEPALQINAWLMYLFMYAPIVILILFSFNASRYASSWEGFSLRWYQVLFNDRAIGLALRNSLLVALLSTLIATVIGTLAALALERYDFWGKLSFDALLYLPIIVPEIAMAVMLLLFFILTHIRLGLGTVIIAHVAFCMSYVAVVVRARVAGLDRTLEEAAQDLYANEWQTFRRVTLPLIMPGIVSGALLSFTLSLDDFVITFFTTGPGTTTLPIQVYGMIKTGVTPEINALSALMLVASVVLVITSLWLQRRT
ncbi:MAG: ABC transporter permease [Anaerolineae bacterium]|uniref:ABC transporter permease n=1 Tax=Candidatus Amarolinea dominans TaxID=3140696 RepID=UPI0031CC5D29